MAPERQNWLDPVLIYYAATLLFLFLDYGADISLRLTFLDGLPAWRLAYYAFLIGCFVLMLKWPQWENVIGLVESVVTVAGIIIATGMRVILVSDEMIEGGRVPLNMRELANFVLSGAMAYVSYYRRMRAVGRQHIF